MGQYVITIAGTGIHHNFKTEKREGENGNFVIPDGRGGYERTTEGDADALAAEFVALLKKYGHHIEHASFTVGGSETLLRPEPAPTA